jgi:lantibiotic modifying enzyme
VTRPQFPEGTPEGIACGWLGGAWVHLALRDAGLGRDREELPTLVRRLRDLLRRAAREDTSHLTGCGAPVVIAAKLQRRRPELRSLLDAAIARWEPMIRDRAELDVMLGAAGGLLACGEIERDAPGAVARPIVARMHRDVLARVRAELRSREPAYLGLAHGLAGYLLALEMTEHVFDLEFPAPLRRACLRRLYATRLDAGRHAVIWPSKSGTSAIGIQAWCNGAPGIGLALLYCGKMRSRGGYGELAEAALRATARFGSSVPIFCCGAVGRAQILLEAYRVTGDPAHRRRALRIVEVVRQQAPPAERTFHRGRLGLDYLVQRIAHVERLPLPGLGIFSCVA